MILDKLDQYISRNLIGKTESKHNIKLRCYHLTNAKNYY